MKKKGFTLIELLAVIVVLAIIAVIAIPIITNVIEKARSSALKDSAYGLIEAANLYYATSITKGEDFDETTFNLVDGKLKSGSKELSYKGQSFKGSSYVAINEVGSVKLMITDGKYYASKEYDEVNITMSDSQDDALTREELTSKINDLEALINSESNIFIKSHPIGSIYITVSPDENSIPAMATKYPGTTWEAYAQGRVLVGVGTGTDSNSEVRSYAPNTTGGEYSHTLIVDELAKHYHNAYMDVLGKNYRLGWDIGGTASSTPGFAPSGGYITGQRGGTLQVDYAGSSQPHNNVQPYVTVYMWKRVS